jgi:hypothetical protein
MTAKFKKRPRKTKASEITNTASSIAAAPKTTKQDRLLTLLSNPAGASIDEMMRATNWQQHSVRGFLAGTVKKKLGFNLTSAIAEGEIRRYFIEARKVS